MLHGQLIQCLIFGETSHLKSNLNNQFNQMLDNVNVIYFSGTSSQQIHILLDSLPLVKDGITIITFFHGTTKYQSCQDTGVTFLLHSLISLPGLVIIFII